MGKLVELRGRRFGRLLVIERAVSLPGGKARWRCSCDCGKETISTGCHLRNGMTSCGCISVEKATVHGLTGTPIWYTWRGMMHRCYHRANTNWTNYGGRGIRVTERWHTLLNFVEDMGERPRGKTLDRVDVNGNYEPQNCRWATQKEQGNNQRRRITNNERDRLLAKIAKLEKQVENISA